MNYPIQTLRDLKNPSFQSFLDMARWIAATIVCLGHLRNPLFYGFGNVELDERNILVIFWYFVTGWFGEAVIIFFVLSGYLVGGIGCAKVANGKFLLPQYTIDRITRLYVAFLPALILTVALDFLGRTYFHDAGLYSHTQAMIAEKINITSFESLANWPNFFGNLVMLQTFIFDSYGTNQPFWTISIEFWFYAVFGVLIALKLSNCWQSKVLNVLLLAIIFFILGFSLLYYIGMWAIGIIIACIGAKNYEKPFIALGIFLCVLLATRFFGNTIEQYQYGIQMRSYAVALSFGYLLFSMRSAKFAILEKIAPLNKFMADFSFSLYLIHFPIMIFALSVFYYTGKFDGIFMGYSPVDGEGVFLYAVIALMIYFSAYIFSIFTEKQTWRYRKLLSKKLDDSKSNSPQ